MNIGNLIYEIREERHMSRAEAAKGICTDKYIYLIENGDRMPSVKILYELSKKLKYNFFHTLSYLSDKNPLALKDAINKFIQLRINNDFEGIKEYIITLKASDSYHKESFKLLIAIHSAYLDYHHKKINAETFKNLTVAFELTEDIHIDDDTYDRTLSYLEVMCLAAYEICNYAYYKVYNYKKLIKIYDLSKSMIRKDESIDIAISILYALSSLSPEYGKIEERCEYIKDFKMHLLDVMDQTSDTTEIYIAKQIISANIDFISGDTKTITDSNGDNIIKVYFLADNIVIFKTLGCNKTIFSEGLKQYYELLTMNFGEDYPFHFIADFTSLSDSHLPLNHFNFNDEIKPKLNLKHEKLRMETYIVIPKLNQTILETIMFLNKEINEVNIFEPYIVSTCLDAIIAITLKKNS